MNLASPDLERDVCRLVMQCCNVQAEVPTEEGFTKPLLGPASLFGLDSLDAVEIVMAVQRAYDVRLGPDDRRQALASIAALAARIREVRGAQAGVGPGALTPP